jgi:transposase
VAYIKGQERNQIILFPESIDDYISDENPVRIIDAFVSNLDMKELGFTRSSPYSVGPPGYDPKDMLKLYLYGYLNQTRTSRRLEREATKNLEVIWLMKKLTPDFKTISEFRRNNKQALRQVFRKFTLLCKEWGLFGKELVAIDGSKFKADNSKKNNFSQKKIDRHLKYIDEKINGYIKMLDEGDAQDSPERNLSASEIKAKIEELNIRKEKYETIQEELTIKGEAELSTTDKDAKLMGGSKKAVEVGYNVQTAVDDKHNLIVDFDVINISSDQNQLSNMALKAKEILGVNELEVLADKGYYNADDLLNCEQNEITTYVPKPAYRNGTGDENFKLDNFKYDPERDVYICPMGHELEREAKKDGTKKLCPYYQNYAACDKCEVKDRCTKAKKGRQIRRSKEQDILDKINARTTENKEKYLKRQMIVEHPFGTVKRAMNAGYFLTRGFASVRAEVSLTFLAYNLKRVINILGVKAIMERLEASYCN